MAEDAPIKDEPSAPDASDTRPSATPEPGAAEVGDPSPPRLAPEAPSEGQQPSVTTETIAVPSTSPSPTLAGDAPQGRRSPPVPPVPADKPRRGRPPGSTNRPTMTQSMQLTYQKMMSKQQYAQQGAALMHQMAHGIPPNMFFQINSHGSMSAMPHGPQLIQPGQQHRQFMQQGGSSNGLPLPLQVQSGTRGGATMAQPQHQQHPNQNQMVPVLMPVPAGLQPNVPTVQLHPTSNPGVFITQDGQRLVIEQPPQMMHPQSQRPQQQTIPMNMIRTDSNGQPQLKRLAVTQDQLQALLQHKHHNQQLHPGWPQHHANMPPGSAAQKLQLMQHQQLTTQNLDRMASSSGIALSGATSSSNSKVNEWLDRQHHTHTEDDRNPPDLHHQKSPPAPKKEEEEEEDAIPQLADETDQILNVESLNPEEVLRQDSIMKGGRKYGGTYGRKEKEPTQVMDGHNVTELNGSSMSMYLNDDDFEPKTNSEVGDDASDRSFEIKREVQPTNAYHGDVKESIVEQATCWMNTRCKMDVPRDERGSESEAEDVKPPPQKKDGKVIRRRKTNELQSLCQMDFGPTENDRRRREIPEMLMNPPDTKSALRGNAGRRSDSAASGSIAAAEKNATTAPKGRRSLRNRDSVDKAKECRSCGNALDEKQNRQYAGYCNAACYRISVSHSPTNTDAEDEDEKTSVRTTTPQPSHKKKEHSVTPSPSVATSPKRRSASAAEVPEKKTPKEEEPTPTRRGRRGAVIKQEPESPPTTPPTSGSTPKKESAAAVAKIKKEVKVEEEEKPSPQDKKRKAEEKKEETTPAKARKTEATATPTAPQAAATPAIVAALAAPPMQLVPQPIQHVQQPTLHQQPMQQRQPAAVLAVAPNAAPAAVPTAAPAAPPTQGSANGIPYDTFKAMTKHQIRDWVEELTNGDKQSAQKFVDEDMDGDAVLLLTEDDLRRDLQLKLGHVKKILQAVSVIRNNNPEKSN